MYKTVQKAEKKLYNLNTLTVYTNLTINIGWFIHGILMITSHVQTVNQMNQEYKNK
jgi:hypothetical protein